MPLSPTGKVQERILAIGGPGAGKSYAFGSIADIAQKTSSVSNFYVLDTDDSWPRLLDTEFSHLNNVVYFSADTWEDYMQAIDKMANVMGEHDWASVDLLTPAWDAVQEYYIEQIYGKDPGQFFLDARKNKNKMALDGWRDWGVINKLYRTFTSQLLRLPGHLYATAVADPVSAETDAPDVVSLFGPFGYKPRGQKHTAHLFHDVLLLQSRGQNSWAMTTIKARGRDQLQGKALNNFAPDYLVNVAKWSLI